MFWWDSARPSLWSSRGELSSFTSVYPTGPQLIKTGVTPVDIVRRLAAMSGRELVVNQLIAGILAIPALLAVAVIAAVVKISDPTRPIFYVDTRVGLHGNDFRMWKFRTMTDDHPQPLGDGVNLPKSPDDARVTRIGQVLRNWSLDELPQVFNVLNGTMGLVGPRAFRKEDMAGVDPEFARFRQSVKPGLTGVWQVLARDSVDRTTWPKYDACQVVLGSTRTDLRILAITAGVVMARGLRALGHKAEYVPRNEVNRALERWVVHRPGLTVANVATAAMLGLGSALTNHAPTPGRSAQLVVATEPEMPHEAQTKEAPAAARKQASRSPHVQSAIERSI